MPAPESVIKLCETFADHRDHYRSGSYNEAHLRKEFLDPLFAALGWDMDNTQGHAPQYRDVIHEDALRVGPHVKAPDYAFTLHGQRKFFLEAKKPAVNIKTDLDPAYQLRRYAWSAKMPLSILSDFEEFAIYDTRIKPVKNDPPSKARTFYCTCDQYAEKWDEIAEIFSKSAILKGSFDKYAESNKKKKGTAEVDADFLAEIERWREMLARNLALRNPSLSVRDLNFAVQKTIDRLVFLRICEDRGTEDYGKLRNVANGTQTYPRLRELFRAADARYNSGLFHFSKENGQAEEPDLLTPNLVIDDKVLKDIIIHLYYPDSSYEFSVMPADILGSVYEQFLGKVINLTPGHRAVVEDKPEVKKAGGVFYTPSYIVDYIVKQTVGRLVEGKTPKQIESIRVLDPACGSGSFLIVAYQFLLDWYHRYYISHDPEKLAKGKNPVLVAARGGGWALTTAERKRILLAHIFGVDIDSQAVEVTKLSLLLKVLEGETTQSVQRELIHQRVLPDLGDNIKCGNSLIGPDFYDQAEMDLLDDEARYRVNVFDWKSAFPEAFKQGGFDCVIGNPPYVRIQAMKEWAPIEVEFYKKAYRSAASGNYDLYVVFVEKALQLLSPKGRSGYILPHKFFNAQYGRNLRELIAKGRHLSEIVHFGHHQVFDGATTYTCLLFLDREHKVTCPFVKVHDLEAWKNRIEEVSKLTNPGDAILREEQAIYRIQRPSIDEVVTVGDIPLAQLGGDDWNFGVGRIASLMRKLQACPVKLGDVAEIFVGLQTSADRVFVVPLDASVEEGATRPFLLTGELAPYTRLQPAAKLLFPYRVDNFSARLVPATEFKAAFPNAWKLLEDNKKELVARENGKWNHSQWYAFGRSQNLTQMEAPKLIVQVTAKRPTVMLDESGLHITGGGSGPFYGIRPKAGRLTLRFLLGIMNSKLFGAIIRAQSTDLRGGYIKFSKQYIQSAAFPHIDFNIPADVEKHDRMVSLVERMLTLVPKRRTEANPQAASQLDAQIAATNTQIDRLVYDLYGLTEEEITLVEGA
jgi:type I restriction-modification system DNA methylase subunit